MFIIDRHKNRWDVSNVAGTELKEICLFEIWAKAETEWNNSSELAISKTHSRPVLSHIPNNCSSRLNTWKLHMPLELQTKFHISSISQFILYQDWYYKYSSVSFYMTIALPDKCPHRGNLDWLVCPLRFCFLYLSSHQTFHKIMLSLKIQISVKDNMHKEKFKT